MKSSPLLINIVGVAYEKYRATLLTVDEVFLAQNEFTWRTETVAFEEAIKEAETLALYPSQNVTWLTSFGQKLYRAVFSGAVQSEYQKRLVLSPEQSVSLTLRIDPKTAQALNRLPWELLHNGKEFLALNPRTSIARLPFEIAPRSLPAIEGELRLLVVVSNPDNLPESSRLDVEAERETILKATENLQRENRLDVVFLEDASLEAIEDALADSPFHILHFTGHGYLNQLTQQGDLLLEDERGGLAAVTGETFIKSLSGSSLRLIVLSACRTATPSHTTAYADVGSKIVRAGFSASLAMQYPVEDSAAICFAGKFYQALTRGEDLHSALAQARRDLLTLQTGPAAHITPVAFIADNNCLQIDKNTPAPSQVTKDIVDFGVIPQMEWGFVARGQELRQLRHHFTQGQWRAAVLYGLGGMGKTALAARFAGRLLEKGTVSGVKVINCTPLLTTNDILSELNEFLNLIGEVRLNPIVHQKIPLQAKVEALAKILETHHLLVIFDNVGDCLTESRSESKTPGIQPDLTDDENPTTFVNPDAEPAITLLVRLVTHSTYFLFTSRADFNLWEGERAGKTVGHLGVNALSFTATVQLINRQDRLASLPVDAEAGMPSKRLLYEKLGGHAWAIEQFARWAKQLSIDAAFQTIEGVEQDMIAFSLVDKAIAKLTPYAALLLKQAAIFEEPVPLEGLAFMLGDDADNMPDISNEVSTLLGWGLLVQLPEAVNFYKQHIPIRRWLLRNLTQTEHSFLLRRAAQFWRSHGNETSYLADYLCARHYLFEAGDYEAADEITQLVMEDLQHLGQIETLLRLLHESIQTLHGRARTMAMGNLALVYQSTGDYRIAAKYYEQVVGELEQAGDHINTAITLHQLGNLNHRQGEYKRSREYYEQSLAMFQTLGDRANQAGSLQQLGVLDYLHGNYEQARQYSQQALTIFQELGNLHGTASSLSQLGLLYQGEPARARNYYEQALKIFQELGEQENIAVSLHHLGNWHYFQGNYQQAHKFYIQSLDICNELKDRASIAKGLHQLGILHQNQGEYERAREYYMKSTAIFQELDDKASTATCLHQLGVLHHNQADYIQARKLIEESLAIRQQLGDRMGAATSLHESGRLHQSQGAYAQAHEQYEQSLKIFQGLNDRAGIASNLHQQGILHYEQQQYMQAKECTEQALIIHRQLGDRMGLASSLGQLGILLQSQNKFKQAKERYQEALKLFQELSDPRGIANTFGQLGLLAEQEKDLARSVAFFVQALRIFTDLGAPERNVTSRNLALLREHMGNDTFEKALKTVDAMDVIQILDSPDPDSEIFSQAHILKVVVQNTTVAMAEAADKKREWWALLGGLQSIAKDKGLSKFAQFLGLVQQLVEGMHPDILTTQVSDEFRGAWLTILNGIKSSRANS